MRVITKILGLVAIFSACQNTSNKEAVYSIEDSAIAKHKYWVSKPFYDALFADNVLDTLSYLPCSELIFDMGDTLLLTSCLSDAGLGIFKVTSPTSLEVVFEGFEEETLVARLDTISGVLHLDPPGGIESGWPTEFIAQEDIVISNVDNVTVQLGRKRLAGNYTMLAAPGQVAQTSLLELHADGTHQGLGDFDKYEPWPSGISGSAVINPSLNLMYLVKTGNEMDQPVLAWQVRGDTLRLWETKNISAEGDLPEYQITTMKGTYLKTN